MKKTLRSILIMGLGAGLVQAAAAADNQPAMPPAAPQAQQPTLVHATNNLTVGN